MKLGWLWGTSAAFAAIALSAACNDDSGMGTEINERTIGFPDGGIADANFGSDGATGVDASKPPLEAGPDATLPPACNDGKLDLGETCDPLASCPTSCAPDKCQLRSLENGGTCGASCANVALQTQCINADGCCPPTCNSSNDSDCIATCGNGVLELGEKCDPKTTCPVAADCKPIGCQKQKLANGDTCTAECVADVGATVTCAESSTTVPDNCCPSNCGADPDCAAGACGNGIVDGTEKCDLGLPGSCPTPATCASAQCKVKELVGTGCQAECISKPDIAECKNGDGCCAAGCNANNDNDCQAVCGNLIREPGEDCDGTCPTSCPAQGCQLFKLQDPGTCKAKCVPDTLETQCKASDSCCPNGCNGGNDNDCVSTCPNGRIDPGETCDNGIGSPTPCPTCGAAPVYTCFAHRGKASTCDVVCNDAMLECSKSDYDSCCPYAGINGASCGERTDVDCQGDGWKVVTLNTPITLKDGQCASVEIDGVFARGSYDLTTCAPPSFGEAPTGNATIADPRQEVGGVATFSVPNAPPVIVPTEVIYRVGNDDCTEPQSVPRLAGWSCANNAGEVRMACASPSPGGFIASYDTPLKVEVCTAAAKGGTFPFSVFYNATKQPSITVTIH